MSHRTALLTRLSMALVLVLVLAACSTTVNVKSPDSDTSSDPAPTTEMSRCDEEQNVMLTAIGSYQQLKGHEPKSQSDLVRTGLLSKPLTYYTVGADGAAKRTDAGKKAGCDK